MDKQAIVIGAGIIGLATARALAVRGYAVTVIERTHKAVGASVRNFGMVWPVGQPDGKLYETAFLSRQLWGEVCKDARIWHEEVGSLHLAYEKDELCVMEEFVAATQMQRNCEIVSREKVMAQSPIAVQEGLLGGLWSPGEMIVDPRQAIHQLPVWLQEKYGVKFIWGKVATAIQYPVVYLGNEEIKADLVFVCSGADFETLYPLQFKELPLTKCKLQMMRLATQPAGLRIGPAICGAMSLTHYYSFAIAASLSDLKKRIVEQYPAYVQWGIHVMASQNEVGEITIGDSHEYGSIHDPFDKQFINQLILDYLQTFARFPNEQIIETWHGIYPKLTNGEAWVVKEPESGVVIINGLGGAGMTLSFGLCEQVIAGIC